MNHNLAGLFASKIPATYERRVTENGLHFKHAFPVICKQVSLVTEA